MSDDKWDKRTADAGKWVDKMIWKVEELQDLHDKIWRATCDGEMHYLEERRRLEAETPRDEAKIEAVLAKSRQWKKVYEKSRRIFAHCNLDS